MRSIDEHSTLKDILDALKNEEQRSRVMNEIKDINPQSEEVMGLKMFLEKNDYEFASLVEFLNKDKIDFKNISSKKKTSRGTPIWLKYAAVLLPFLGIGYFMLNDGSGDLYNKYYEKEVGLPVTMGVDSAVTFNNAMNAFKDDSYDEAINGFNELLASNPSNDTLHYFLGCSYMETGKIDRAEINYLNINENSVFKQKVDYRLALIYIKKEEYDTARMVLVKIETNKNHRYNSEARKILNESPFKE